MGVLIITHYQRILHMVEPARSCTIMFEGRIVKEGGPELVEQLEQRGLRLDPRRGRRRRPDEPLAGRPRSRASSPSSTREGLVYLDSRRDVADAARR